MRIDVDDYWWAEFVRSIEKLRHHEKLSECGVLYCAGNVLVAARAVVDSARSNHDGDSDPIQVVTRGYKSDDNAD